MTTVEFIVDLMQSGAIIMLALAVIVLARAIRRVTLALQALLAAWRRDE